MEELSVLLATSDHYLQERLLEVFKERGYLVVVVNSCKKALENLLDSNFDVVVFDPEIKELERLDTVQLIKKIRPKTPIIVVSDESSYETGVKIAEVGVYFRLGKPLNEKITKELVQNLADKMKDNKK